MSSYGCDWTVLALNLLPEFSMEVNTHGSFGMRRCLALAAILTAVLAGVACHPQPKIVTTSSAAIGGTIAGILNGPPANELGNRTITLVNIATGQRYQTTTGQTGGYSLRVPAGTYRLEIELHNGEQLAQKDQPILLRNGDGDAGSNVGVNANRE